MRQFLRDFAETLLAGLFVLLLMTLLAIVLPPIPDKTGPMMNESMAYYRR